ncbi:hypothetical protein Tco_0659801 [Tanacetum coccineum]
MLNHLKAEPIGVLKDVLCQVGVTTIITKFLILDMPIDRDAPILVAKTILNTEEIDSDDEEDYGIQRNSFGMPMYGPKPAKYLNGNDSIGRALALQDVINSFRKSYVWKKAVDFLGSLPIPLQHMKWKPDYKGNFYKKEEGDRQTLDANILRELFGSNKRLIPEEIAPSILRLATLRAPRPTNSDLYEKISHLETQIGKIERMTRRQSYHSERYARVLKHIALHFGLTLCDPYDPPSYFKQQQQQNDEE